MQFTFSVHVQIRLHLHIQCGHVHVLEYRQRQLQLVVNQSPRHETCVYKNNLAVIHLLRHDDELLYGIWSTRSRYMRHTH